MYIQSVCVSLNFYSARVLVRKQPFWFALGIDYITGKNSNLLLLGGWKCHFHQQHQNFLHRNTQSNIPEYKNHSHKNPRNAFKHFIQPSRCLALDQVANHRLSIKCSPVENAYFIFVVNKDPQYWLSFSSCTPRSVQSISCSVKRTF